MKRIWCLLGLHDWLFTWRIDIDLRTTSGYAATARSRRCLRCKREEEWVAKPIAARDVGPVTPGLSYEEHSERQLDRLLRDIKKVAP